MLHHRDIQLQQYIVMVVLLQTIVNHHSFGLFRSDNDESSSLMTRKGTPTTSLQYSMKRLQSWASWYFVDTTKQAQVY